VTLVRPGSKDLIREINEALVLGTIRRDGPVARARIAETTGLSPATVTILTAHLTEAGLVHETAQGPSTGGRPPRLLMLNPGGGHAVGMRLTETHVNATLVDLVGTVVRHQRAPHRRSTASEAAQTIADVFGQLVQSAGDPPVLGLGLALSGVIDHESGIVRHSGSLGWQDAPLRALLADKLALPVSIDNNVNALATALMMDDKPLAKQDLMIVNIGPSVGLTLVCGGRIRRGAHGTAGTFAHTSCSLVSESRRACHCGARDCLETVASEWGMLRELRRAVRRDIQIGEAADGAADDPRVRAVFTTAGRALGRAAANVAKVFDPHRVVVVGEGVRLGAPLLDPFEAEFHRVSRNDAGRDFEVQSSSPDETTWPRGAAWQLLSEVFEVPLSAPRPGRRWR
jgi:predicted NBD/HSP70 family sugar kinase